MFKNFIILIIYKVLRKINLFILKSVNIYNITVYLFDTKVQDTIKYGLSIN